MVNFLRNLFSVYNTPLINASRGKKQWMRPYLASLYKRRLEQGPEPERARSEWINWNYNGELFCFGKRLSEEFNISVLKRAFITKSYADIEKEKRKLLLLDNSEFNLDNQDDLVKDGSALLSEIVSKLTQKMYPCLPKEGQKSIVSHLTSVEVLSHIGLHLGIKDLLLYPKVQIPNQTISDTFKAVVATLNQSDSSRTENFINDFVMTQLVGKDIEELWPMVNPMGILTQECHGRNMEPPEPRLLWATGTSTIMACYMVAIYSNKKFLGKGAGETLLIAEEMAARDCLNRLYDVTIKMQSHF